VASWGRSRSVWRDSFPIQRCSTRRRGPGETRPAFSFGALSLSRWLRVGGYGLGLLGTAYLLYLLRQGLAPSLLASAITYVVEPPVKALERKQVPRVAAILMVYAGGLAVLALAAWVVIPVLMAELKSLSSAPAARASPGYGQWLPAFSR